MSKEQKNNSPLRKRNTSNKKHNLGKAVLFADCVTTNMAAYNLFRQQYPGFSRNETRNTIHDYKAIIIALNQFYINYAIETGNLIILPNKIGKLGVQKFKKAIMQKPDGTYNLPINRLETKRTGKVVYHLNEHTDGNSFKWSWLKPKNNHGLREWGKGFHPAWWSLKPATVAQRTLAAKLKEPGYDWDKYHYMTSRVKERLIRNRIKREANANT